VEVRSMAGLNNREDGVDSLIEGREVGGGESASSD